MSINFKLFINALDLFRHSLCQPKTVMVNLFQHLKEIPNDPGSSPGLKVRDDTGVVAKLSCERSRVEPGFTSQDKRSNPRGIFWPRLSYSKFLFFMLLVSYINQLAFQFLIVSSLFLFQTSSLKAMEVEETLKNKKQKRHDDKDSLYPKDPYRNTKKFKTDNSNIAVPVSLKRTNVGEEQPFWEIAKRLENTKSDIDNWLEKIFSFQENSVSFTSNDIEKYKNIFAMSTNETEFLQKLINSKNTKNEMSGNTGAEVIIFPYKNANIVIKTFKDFQLGLKELFNSLIALRIKPSKELKMAEIYDAVFVPNHGLSIIMEGIYSHDIYHFLSTPQAEMAIKACAHYLAKFHIDSHHDLFNSINEKQTKKYLDHLAKSSFTLHDSEKEGVMGLLSLSTGISVSPSNISSKDEIFILEDIKSNTIINFLSLQEQQRFRALGKYFLKAFCENSHKIYQSLTNEKEKIYPITRVHGDAHVGNFFYDDRNHSQNGETIPEDSDLRIGMIDFGSMPRTLCGGNLEEDVGRFDGSLWVGDIQNLKDEKDYYKKIFSFQEIFNKNYMEKIIESGIILKERIEDFKKIFADNCNFYKLRFYKVIFNLPSHKMSNENKLKILRFWIKENSKLEIPEEKMSPANSPIKRKQSSLLPPIEEAIKYWLPEKPKLFIDNTDEGKNESNLMNLLIRSLKENSSSTTITGMGGVGKSTLALQYAHEALKNRAYNLIYWLWSETDFSLLQGYRNLLLKIGIPIKGLTDQDVINLIQANLPKQRKCLLIYDNVPYPSFLEGKVPDGVHRIYTSRCNEGWENSPLSLNVFSPETSVKYLCTITGLEANEENEKKARELAEELGHHPLGLSHFAYYINLEEGKNVTGKSFTKYFDKFRANSPSYFEWYKDPFKKESQKMTYENLIGKTYLMSSTRLSDLAKKLMIIASYLDPDCITEELIAAWVEEKEQLEEDFSQLSSSSLTKRTRYEPLSSLYRAGKNEEQLEEALSQLSSLSLIKRTQNDSSFSLHRLVQVVIRNEEESRRTIQEIQQFFKGFVFFLEKTFIKKLEYMSANINNNRLFNYISQIENICKHAERLNLIDENFSLLRWLNALFINMSTAQSGSICLSTASKKMSSLGEIPTDLAQIARDRHYVISDALGRIYENCEDEDLEKALYWYKIAYNKGFKLVACDIGLTYERQGKEKKAIKWFSEAANHEDEDALFFLNDYAESGYAEAEFQLGALYAHGRGVDQNNNRAAEYFERAAESGHREACTFWGLLRLSDGEAVSSEYILK